jgi:hypothetical protein
MPQVGWENKKPVIFREKKTWISQRDVLRFDDPENLNLCFFGVCVKTLEIQFSFGCWFNTEWFENVGGETHSSTRPWNGKLFLSNRFTEMPKPSCLWFNFIRFSPRDCQQLLGPLSLGYSISPVVWGINAQRTSINPYAINTVSTSANIRFV